jgi:hypothetical protein
MLGFEALIERTRGSSSNSTEYLIKLVKETGGYLIVSNENIKKIISKENPKITDQIITYEYIERKKYDLNLDLQSKPLFFDNTAIMKFILDQYAKGQINTPQLQPDGYHIAGNFGIVSNQDGYQLTNQEYKQQLNVKLTDEDMKIIKEINKDFFENEASNSMLGRILVRKGIAFYKKLRESL